MTAKVSVIIPVYNGARFVSVAIGSIIAQSFSDWELLLIDDGSTDQSREILNTFSDSRIKIYYNETNQGLAAVRNRGIALAQGRYIAWLDQDDIAAPARLEKQFSFLENNPEYIFCGSFMQTIGSANQSWTYPESNDEIQISMQFFNCLPNPAGFFRIQEVRDNNIRYRALFAPAEDYHFLSRLLKFGKACNIPEYLVYYRLHGEQASTLKSERQRRAACRVAAAPVRLQFGRSKIGVVNFHLALSDTGNTYRMPQNWRNSDVIQYLEWNGQIHQSKIWIPVMKSRLTKLIQNFSIIYRLWIFFRLSSAGFWVVVPDFGWILCPKVTSVILRTYKFIVRRRRKEHAERR